MTMELPRGWATKPLSELGTWLGGGTPSKAVPEFWSNGLIPWVSPKDMKRLVIDSAQDQITERALAASATNLVPRHSVLMVTRSGILEHTFPVAVNSVPVTINQDLKAWTPNGVNSFYAAYYLRARQQQVLRDCSKDGTTVSSIDFDQLSKFPMVVAPQREQERIVSRIEELFSEIDEGERALERVQKMVERYRQSILKAAVSGELTKLRKTETGLPQGWELRSLADLCLEKPCNGISVKGTDSPPGVAALRLDAMTETGFDFLARRFIPITAAKADRLAIRAGDFFVSRANGSLQLVGRGVLASRPPGPTVFPDTMIRYRLGKSEALQRWVAIAWASGWVRRQVEVKAKTTAGIYKISQSDIAEISFPVPSTEAEMLRIAEAVAIQAGAWRRLVQELSDRIRQSSALRQAVLQAAFSGQLVPQDPTDEPASVLLARLTAQGSEAAPALRRRGRPAVPTQP